MNKFKINDKVLVSFLGKEYVGYVDVVNKISANGKDFYGYSVEYEDEKGKAVHDSFAEYEMVLLTDE